jgi:hypothetical protein
MRDEHRREPKTEIIIEVDLTSLCVRSASLRLPYNAQGLFEKPTTLLLQNPESGKNYELLYTPPRDLTKLEAFFQATDAKANDKLILKLFGSEGLIVLHKRQTSRSHSHRDRDRAAPKAAPRRQPEWEARQATVSEQKTQFTPAVMVRHLNAAKPAEAHSEVLPIKQPNLVPGPTEEAAPVQAQIVREPEAELSQIPTPQATKYQLDEPAQPQQVTSAAVLKEVLEYLNRPSIPVILRSEDLAEELRLPIKTVQQALEHLSQQPDANLRAIKQGVFQIIRRGTNVT